MTIFRYNKPYNGHRSKIFYLMLKIVTKFLRKVNKYSTSISLNRMPYWVKSTADVLLKESVVFLNFVFVRGFVNVCFNGYYHAKLIN